MLLGSLINSVVSLALLSRHLLLKPRCPRAWVFWSSASIPYSRHAVDDIDPVLPYMTLDSGDYGIFLLILMGNAAFISYTVTPRFGNFLCLPKLRWAWRVAASRRARGAGKEGSHLVAV